MLEPPRSSAEAPYTSLRWCGSCRCDVLEPPRRSAEALASSVLVSFVRFEEVRCA